MEAVIVALISGFFSLAAIWYQSYLQRKSTLAEPAPAVYDTGPPRARAEPASPVLRIVFTLLLVASPLLILLLFGKSRLHLEDRTWVSNNRLYTTEPGFLVYYAVWSGIMLLAVVVGWARKTRFEKIVLVAAFTVLAAITLTVLYNTLNDPGYPIGTTQAMEAAHPTKPTKKRP